ncbi:MAG TPA: SIS domain-containing protein [Candidatus Bathyarchaeia archaeon]|nr:SIS domain-containing protein [Candidatus Bathyarchaeia archaeon]
MSSEISNVTFVNRIFQNLEQANRNEIESVYHDIMSSGVILPSGEGRSKGALSIACSEMAKMRGGKLVLDRGDIGFPGRTLYQAAPILKQRFGQVCLLINSGSGKSLMPLLDAQQLAMYIANQGNPRDFRIDVVTSERDSPMGKLGTRYGNVLILKGREPEEAPSESKEFRTTGILEDLFILGTGVLFHSMAEAMNEEASADRVIARSKELFTEVGSVVDEMVSSEFFKTLVDALEQRRSCFLVGLGSAREVARMTAVRIGHVKRAMGDQIYVAGESNTPGPRAGDVLIVISHSGETEIVAGWCKNFKRMGALVASVVGNPDSTIAAASDISFTIKGERIEGKPDSFYVKAAFALSPLPIYLVEKVGERGLRLPEYILRWHHSVTS